MENLSCYTHKVDSNAIKIYNEHSMGTILDGEFVIIKRQSKTAREYTYIYVYLRCN